MHKYNIGVVVGSIRKDSINNKLAHSLAKLAPKDYAFNFLNIDKLPLYNQDDDNNPAESVKQFKQEISNMDAILFVTPEYNRSIPGVLKNAIDQASRPYGQSAWSGIPAAIVGVSVGAMGTALAQQHLRNIISHLNMPTLGQPEVFLQATEDLIDKDGNIGSTKKEFLQKWMDKFVDWIQTHKKAT